MSLSDILSNPSIPAQKNLLFSNPDMFGLSGLFERGGMPGLDAFLLDASKSGDIEAFLRKLLRSGPRLRSSSLLGGL
jgi:hypothetical protein